MEMNQFAEEIKERIIGKIEDVTEVSIKKVLKNNSISLTGLVFKDERSNVSPTLYMDYFYELYKKGGENDNLDVIAGMVVKAYQEARLEGNMDFSFVRDWEQVKTMVAYKLINRERNQELLKQIPHKDVLDLSMVFYLSLSQGTILIDYRYCNEWGISLEELVQIAEENTPKICPMRLKTMGEIVRELIGEDSDEVEQMYVLSNVTGIFGAAVMLYPNSLDMVAERLQSDLYILPSSTHETIILPVKIEDELNKLVEMVREVNKTVLNADEVLGDNVYLYKREEREICLAA